MKIYRDNKLFQSRLKFGMFFIIFLVIFGAAVLMNGLFPIQKVKASAGSTLYFDPASRSVGTGRNFTLDAMVNPGGGNELIAVQLRVTFDPTKFRLDGISNAGSPFSKILYATGQPQYTIDNTAGTAAIDLAVDTGNPMVTSLSKIATFTFHSLATVSNSSISFTNDSVAAGSEIGDLIVTRTSAGITVTGVTYSNSDFANLVSDWLQTKSSPADVNGDGTVNARDLGIMMSNWQ